MHENKPSGAEFRCGPGHVHHLNQPSASQRTLSRRNDMSPVLTLQFLQISPQLDFPAI